MRNRRGAARPAAPAIASVPRAGERGDEPAVRVARAPRAAAAPEEVDGPVGRDFYGAGAIAPGGGRRTAASAVLGLAGSGEGPDNPRGEIDDPHAMVRDVGDEEPGLCGVERQAVRLD